jgi:hypothetical protein
MIGCKEQIDYVTKGDVSSSMVLEYAGIGGPKKSKHNNRGVIDGTGENECMISADKKVLVSHEIPGVNPGYDKSRRVRMKNAAVKLIVLDSENDYNNVGESTGVDMHDHEVAIHEMVLLMDQKIGNSRNYNFLLKQGERIVVDLLLDNKSPFPWEQNGKTPSWEKDNVCQREVDWNHYG